MTEGASKPWPAELRLRKDKKTLSVVFDSGATFDLSAEYLRVQSPSAEVQGHSPDERKTVGGKKDVAILEVHPIGNYAVRLVFDDMHSTGIYSWDYLYELGRKAEVEAFAARMAAMGKIERTAEDAPKEGVFTGAHATNPFTGQPSRLCRQ